MSVFKKLAGLLFEEADAEVLAEDELEPIEIKGKAKESNGFSCRRGRKNACADGVLFQSACSRSEGAEKRKKRSL